MGLSQEPKLSDHKKARLVRLLQEEDLVLEAIKSPSCWKFRVYCDGGAEDEKSTY